MSEQPHYKTTPAQGWDQMRSILDREMPVTRRRDRFVLFWRFFNATLILGVLSIGLYKGIHVLAQKPVPAEEIRVAEDQKPSTVTETIMQGKSGVSPEGNSSSISNPTPEAPDAESSIRSSGSKPLQKPVLPASKNQKMERPKQKEPMAFQTNKRQDLLPVSTTDQFSGLNSSEQTMVIVNINDETIHTPGTKTEPVDHLHPLRNGQVVDPVPPMPVVLVASAVSSSVGPIAPVLTNADRNRVSVRPFVALEGLAGFNGGSGGQAAAGLDVGLSKRLTLTTGLSYRDFSPHSSLFTHSRDVAADPQQNAIVNHETNYGGYPAYIVGDLLGSSTSYQAINPLIDQVRQWQVQAGVRYHITRRLFAEGGILFAFSTDVTSQYPIIQGDPLVASPFSKVSNSLTDYDVVRSSMTSWYGGIGLLFGRHLSLNANWTHGLNTYLLADTPDQSTDVQSVSRSDYIRGISLGIRYTL